MELSRRGHHVIATARHIEALSDLTTGARLRLDVADQPSVDAAIAAAGQIDVLVSNAGETLRAPVESVPLHEVERLFQLNTLGALRVTQAVLPVMRSRGSAWVNAGHPAPLLIRDRRVVRALENPGTLPVGFGGATPQISEQLLRRGDRVLFFNDGAIEEHKPGGEQFGQERLIEFVERAGRVGEGVQEMVRNLSHSPTRARGGATTDYATLFLVEWRVAPLATSPPWKCYHVARPQTQSVIMWRGGAWRRRQRSDITVSWTLDDLVVAVRRAVQIAWQRAVQMVVTALVVVGPFAGPPPGPARRLALAQASMRDPFAGYACPCPVGSSPGVSAAPRGSAIELPTPIAGIGSGRS